MPGKPDTDIILMHTILLSLRAKFKTKRLTKWMLTQKTGPTRGTVQLLLESDLAGLICTVINGPHQLPWWTLQPALAGELLSCVLLAIPTVAAFCVFLILSSRLPSPKKHISGWVITPVKP
jgi:hypothetical protein